MSHLVSVFNKPKVARFHHFEPISTHWRLLRLYTPYTVERRLYVNTYPLFLKSETDRPGRLYGTSSCLATTLLIQPEPDS